MQRVRASTLFAIVESSQPVRAEGRRRAIPLAVSTLLTGASVHMLYLQVQLYLKGLGTSTFLIGMVATLMAGGMLAGGLMWGTISDHVRRRRLLFLLALGLALATGVLSFLPPTPVVLGLSFIRSLFFSGLGAVAIAVISASSRIERRGKNLSYVSSARALGFAIGAASSGVLLEILGFRAAFAVSACLPLVAALVLLRLPDDNPVQRPRPTHAWREALTKGLGDLYIAVALRQMAVFGAFALLIVYMDTIGIPPSMMGIVAASNTITQVLALVAFGWLADRVGRRRVFMFGSALSIVTPLVFVVLPNLLGMALGYVTLGIGFSSLHVGATAHIGDRVSEEKQGQMLGLYESSRGLGGLAGPAVAGAIIPAIGFQGMFIVMAGIAGLGFLLMLFGQTLRRRLAARRAIREATR